MLEHSKWLSSGKPAACPCFIRAFAVAPDLCRAVLTITAAGVYDARINGRPVTDFFLAPGWTSYLYRHQVQEYDVTHLLDTHNQLEVTVGSGWFNGEIARTRRPKDTPVLLLAQLDLYHADGHVEHIYTDEQWLSAESPVRMADIYQGETCDTNFRDTAPVPAVAFDYPKTQLIPQEGEQITLQEQLKPVRIFTTPAGDTVADFGQEITGIVRVELDAPADTVITLQCAEVLDADGNFYTANYRSAKSTMELHCSGPTCWQPRLTYYGFRYLRITGWPGSVDPDALTAIVVHSEMTRTGRLSCGVPKLNRLFENVVWGQKGNFVDVPTDCPQRDERLGWTGDAQVFINTACYLFDTKKFYTKWLGDLMADQRSTGAVPSVIPDVFHGPKNIRIKSSTAWGDAATVCPWQLYRHYGDLDLLRTHFGTMKRWVDYMTSITTTPYLWTGYQTLTDRVFNPEHYGDWLGLDAPEGSYTGSSRKDLIASAFYAYSTELVIRAGHALHEDVSDYETLYENIVAAFRAAYDGDYRTQTEHVLALHFHLTADPEATAAGLAQLIRDNGDRLTTGFVGTPYLLYALSDNGYPDLAYSLLLQEQFPSWLFSVNQGATTIWEHWDGQKADGSFWSPDMNSFNHYAYGSVAGWVFETAAGITPCEELPGFARIRVVPRPDARLGWLDVSLETAFGTVVSRWFCENGRVRYEITVPVASEIVIDGKVREVPAGSYVFWGSVPKAR